MKLWANDPAPELNRVFGNIARHSMRDLPICNQRLMVEAIGFMRYPESHWIGAMVTPWAINLLRLPGEARTWPTSPVGGKHAWQFPSGSYEFIVANERSLDCYHLCSLFSPALEFESHRHASLVALTALKALFTPPTSSGEKSEFPSSYMTRREFFGLSLSDCPQKLDRYK